nr:disulfide oxidoreductase [Bacillus subtilis]
MKNRIVFLYASWVVALIAMLGSLYFSEIRKFIPCELCWYQRILMYPLVLILGIATFQGDTRVKKYVLPMAIIGAFISTMHYLEQKVPGFSGIKPCVSGVPCSRPNILTGLVLLRFHSCTLIAFILIIIFMCLLKGEKSE